MKRIWCVLGVHDWLVSYRATGFHDDLHVKPVSRECLRCKRFAEWVVTKR